MSHPQDVPGCSEVRSHLADASGEGLLVTASPSLIGCLATGQPRGRWRLLSTGDALEAVASVAYLGWSLRTRRETDPMRVRAAETVDPPSAVIDRERLVAILEVDGALFALPGTEPELVAAGRSRWESAWERADPFDVPAPGRRRVERTLTDRLGRSVSTVAFEAFDAIWPAQLAGSGPNALEVVVLAAARYDRRLQRVGDWAEAIDLGSRGEVSRVKRRLTELGLVETTAVEGAVGRPPLRLHLSDDGVDALAPGALAEVVRLLLDE